MWQVAAFALAFLGVSVAVFAGTGDSENKADLANREACHRAISHGVLPIAGSEQRVSDCIALAARQASEPTMAQVASSELVARR